MKSLLFKVAAALVLLVVAGLASLAIALGHDSACGSAPSLPDDAARMKAVVRRCYGPPQVLRLEVIQKVAVTDNEVLVKVHAAAINPVDWHYIRGTPYIMRMESGLGAPKNARLGVDFAGTVEAVGRNVTRFKPGDEVFGGKNGALAEYVRLKEDGALVLKPANLSFGQAASVGVAATTALQALRDKGRVRPGQKVLINGASGGVGTFAVQIAKSLGAEVTGVCSTRNVEMVRSIGADHVIDYTREDFTESGQHYDVILDNVGNRALLDVRRVLAPDGRYVLIGGGGPDAGSWVGPFVAPVKALLLSHFVSQRMGMFIANLNKEDLTVLSDLMRTGQVTPVIDRTYRLDEIAAAVAYLEEGHARGKVVINVD